MSVAPPASRDDPRSIFGWCMYDWANSAYGTTVLAGLLGVYIAEVVAPDGAVVLGYPVPPTSLFSIVGALSAAVIFVLAPVLGAIADFTRAKKRFLLAFAFTGAVATLLLWFAGSGNVGFTLGVFFVAQTSFVAANVFYDAFLPVIVSDENMDAVSGRGYAYGYVGGGLQFLMSLLLVAFYDQIGISQDTAVRASMVGAGLWWAGFTLVTARYLVEPGHVRGPDGGETVLGGVLALVRLGLSRTLETTRRVRRFRHLLLFLVAFLFYNDGIQTAIVITSSYGTDVLDLEPEILMVTLLIIQIVAVGGALLFSRLAGVIGTRQAIMVSLVGWSLLVVFAYTLEPGQQIRYMLMGGLAGLVLGGSQALSRSLYGSMIPPEASAEFYGFYSVFAKFSAIWGLLVFGLVGIMGSLRSGILSLVVFFAVGLVLLWFVDEEKARAASAKGAF
jgi:UMF1 family MFS transporter